MGWLQQLAGWFSQLKCWYTVRPWERAIRVRFGNLIIAVEPGLKFRLPFFDQVFIQNVRRRVLNLPVQTVTTKTGETVTLSGVVHWRIDNVRVIYERLHTPEDWILNTVMAAIAEKVYESNGDLSPAAIGRAATSTLTAEGHDGLAIELVSVTDMARVRTYRLITGEGNSGWSWSRVGSLDSAHG